MRVAGLRYFEILKEKLRERRADYKVLYAFTNFVHPQTDRAINEHSLNELTDGEVIEERFKRTDYRLLIVASKFQTGFNEPLLAGMFLDKPLLDRNAVQTVSRLNRKCGGKNEVVVVDFTNNAAAILRAFAKYRHGTPFEAEEPDQEQPIRWYRRILETKVFTQADAKEIVKLLATGNDALVQFNVNGLRVRFQSRISDTTARKDFVHLMARFVKSYHFLSSFCSYSRDIQESAAFAEYVGPQLIKQGSISELTKQIRRTEVVKAAVQYQGEVRSTAPIRLTLRKGNRGPGPPQQKVSVRDMIEQIRLQFDISEEEALYIREVTNEKINDPVIRATVSTHQDDQVYLQDVYAGHVNQEIQMSYAARDRYEELTDPKYIETGAIFDIMAFTVIEQNREILSSSQ